MGKIRINELARELEVKSNVIIDYLAGIGIPDKKSHSSALDDDLADKVRAHFRVGGVDGALEVAARTVAPAPPRPRGIRNSRPLRPAPRILLDTRTKVHDFIRTPTR